MKRKAYQLILPVLAACTLPFLIGPLHGQQTADNVFYSVAVVRRIVLKNQTGAILPMTLFTSGKKGLFRVSAYAETTKVGTQGIVCGSLTWTDDAGEQLASLWNSPNGCLSVNNLTSATGQTLVLTTAHQPVTFSANVSVAFEGSPEYEVVIIVEELQPIG